jgi:hypothetical protein
MPSMSRRSGRQHIDPLRGHPPARDGLDILIRDDTLEFAAAAVELFEKLGYPTPNGERGGGPFGGSKRQL